MIVPGLMTAAGLPMRIAMGTSLVAVAVFGLTALASYAASGYVDWPIAGLMTLGGFLGAVAASAVSARLFQNRKALGLTFALVVIITGAYVMWQGWTALA